jgi:hypothetical protein
MIGRDAWGHVSRTGPRPTKPEQFFDANAPFVETVEQAKHFKLGKEIYDGCIRPWDKPIASPYLDRALKGEPTYEVDGVWPWEEAFFPKPFVAAEAAE